MCHFRRSDPARGQLFGIDLAAFANHTVGGAMMAGPDFAPPGQETGTYQVNSDCTGSMVINLNVPNVPSGTSSGVIDIMFVISDGGRHIHAVVSQFTRPGSSGPVPTQTSADDWKVASDKD